MQCPDFEETFGDVSPECDNLKGRKIRRSSSSASPEVRDPTGKDSVLDSTVSVESLNLDVPSSYKVETGKKKMSEKSTLHLCNNNS